MARVALATGDSRPGGAITREAEAALRGSAPWFMLLPLYLLSDPGRAGAAVPTKAIALVREKASIHIRELHDKFAFVHTLVPLAAAVALKGD